MQTNIFPPVYNEQSDKDADEMSKEFRQARARIVFRPRTVKKKDEPEKAMYSLVSIVVGVILGFMGFGAVVNYNGLVSFVVFCCICTISWFIGMKIYDLVKQSVKNTNERSDLVYQKEIAACDKQIEAIKNQAARDQQNYLAAFEKNAQEMSVKLAESRLAKRVIEWMTDGFCRTIDAADRRKHIEQISVPFRFEVYTNKITCNLGIFDFEIERCRNLSSPLEQTALARAIAAAIQLNITMKYPKDASGTDRTVNYDFSYTDTYPVVTLTYLAPNGNYQVVIDW